MPLTPDDHAEIRARYVPFDRGLNGRKGIARDYGITPDRVTAIVGATRRWTTTQTKRLKVMVADGRTARDIAGVLGITQSAIRSKCERMGWPAPRYDPEQRRRVTSAGIRAAWADPVRRERRMEALRATRECG